MRENALYPPKLPSEFLLQVKSRRAYAVLVLFLFRALGIAALVFLSSCGGVDTSFFSVANIPPPPAGKCQIVVFANHQHRLSGSAYVDGSEVREFSGSALGQFIVDPGQHELTVILAQGENRLESNPFVLNSGETAYYALVTKRISGRNWTSHAAAMHGEEDIPEITHAKIDLSRMTRPQADEYWSRKKIW